LQRLDLGFTNVSVDVLIRACELPCLTELGVSRPGHCDEFVERLVRVRGRLTRLDFSSHRNKLTDAGLAALGKLQSLQTLELANCRHVSSAGLAELANLRKLRHLDLPACATRGAPQFWRALAMPLERLVLSRAGGLSHKDLHHIFSMSSLLVLDLSSVMFESDVPFDAANLLLLMTQRLVNLEHLDMSGLLFSREDFAVMRSLRSLRTLVLREMEEAYLAELRGHPKLESLDLKDSRLDAADLVAGLSSLPKLVYCDLRACDIEETPLASDALLVARLKELPRLELMLSSCK
jgi:hypothetical protein